MAFPSGFVWGAATSAYQVEGAATLEGRGPSIFEAWTAQSGNVYLNHTGARAADHYHRVDEDVALMKEIGLRAYRFSVSWSRVLPDGRAGAGGRGVNLAGLGWYDLLVDRLLEAGITPWVTLFHWDLPLALQHRGGWFNREIAAWMGDYASVVVDRLSDRVRHWITINEPQVFIKFGHGDGTLAPGLKVGLDQQVVAAHQALRAHGAACQAIRARAKTSPSVGWAPIGRTDFPATESSADIEAARRGTCGVLTPDLWNNTWFADPVFRGAYPEDGLRLFGPGAAPPIEPGDMELIRQPVDFYGLNIYDGRAVRAGADGGPEPVAFADGHAQTAFRWFVTPEALRWGPRLLYERYRVPVVITENGLSNVDWVMDDGRVHDPQRVDYTKRYLRELRRAIADGADVRGYFHWSLMDNFEWAAGYRERFGLIHVDYATGRRTVKESARWYRGVIESNGASLG
jgi:beta-glucosidase